MIVTCVVGVLGGFIGALPLLVIRRLAVKPGTVVHKQPILFGLLGILCSLALCLVIMFIYREFDAEHFVAFGIVVIVIFLVVNTVSVVLGLRSIKDT